MRPRVLLKWRRATALAGIVTLVLSACDKPLITSPVKPTATATNDLSTTPTSQLYTSGSNVTAYDPLPGGTDPHWDVDVCTTVPSISKDDPRWVHPHSAFVLNGHPWQYSYGINTPWINAWPALEETPLPSWFPSAGFVAAAPNTYFNWSKYTTTVSGNGTFQLDLLADNCSWVYLDNQLVGVQGTDLNKHSYGVTLNGTSTLTFLIFDGGGLAGGQFKLQTTTNPPPPLVVPGAPPATGDIVIDNFSGGAVTNSSPPWFGYLLQRSVSGAVGATREIGWYDYSSFKVDPSAGDMEWGLHFTTSPKNAVAYGSAIGTNPAETPGGDASNSGPQLHLNLNLQDQFVVDLSQITSGDPLRIMLWAGDGQPFYYDMQMPAMIPETGPVELRAPLSAFKLFGGSFRAPTAAEAADIDGISLRHTGDGSNAVGGTRFTRIAISQAVVDNTPPDITPTITGTQGTGNWYTSNVSVTWSVTDAQSTVSNKSGCDKTDITTNTTSSGQTLTCTATSAGGKATKSVTIYRDATVPTVTGAVTSGTLSPTGWYTSDVGVTWTPSAAGPSGQTLSTDCSNTTLSTDAATYTFTCTVTTGAGIASAQGTVTVKRDATPPVVTYSGNAGSYTVDQSVNIMCTPSDNLSGVASSTCKNITGDGYLFALGPNSYSATATDNAGNVSATATASFTMAVTRGSLCNLVRRWSDNAGVANSLCVKLSHGDYDPFRNELNAQSGKHIPADKAAILLRLVNAL